VGAELTGAIAAAATLHVILDPVGHQGTSYPKGTRGQSLGMEILLTTLLITVALSVAARHRLLGPQSAIAMGATIAAAGIIGIAVSGASMNPARSLGPALVAGISADQWIYVVGPLAGALIGVAVVTVCQGPPKSEEAEAAEGDDNR
jgi:glycerol uptake facilitator-like aquaporin